MLAIEETYACGAIGLFCRLLRLPRERWKSVKVEQRPPPPPLYDSEYMQFQVRGHLLEGEHSLLMTLLPNFHAAKVRYMFLNFLYFLVLIIFGLCRYLRQNFLIT